MGRFLLLSLTRKARRRTPEASDAVPGRFTGYFISVYALYFAYAARAGLLVTNRAYSRRKGMINERERSYIGKRKL